MFQTPHQAFVSPEGKAASARNKAHCCNQPYHETKPLSSSPMHPYIYPSSFHPNLKTLYPHRESFSSTTSFYPPHHTFRPSSSPYISLQLSTIHKANPTRPSPQELPSKQASMHPLLLLLLVLLLAICFIHLTKFVWRAVGAIMRISWKVICFTVRAIGTCVCMFLLVVFCGVGVWVVVGAAAAR